MIRMHYKCLLPTRAFIPYDIPTETLSCQSSAHQLLIAVRGEFRVSVLEFKKACMSIAHNTPVRSACGREPEDLEGRKLQTKLFVELRLELGLALGHFVSAQFGPVPTFHFIGTFNCGKLCRSRISLTRASVSGVCASPPRASCTVNRIKKPVYFRSLCSSTPFLFR